MSDWLARAAILTFTSFGRKRALAADRLLLPRSSSVTPSLHTIGTWHSTLGFVAILNGPMAPIIGYRAVGFVFLLTVLIISLFVSMGPILFAAAVSVLLWDYFFIPPQMTFVIAEKEDFIMCGMYFVAAITTGVLTNRIRRRERLLRSREERTTLLYEIVSDIVRASNRSEFIQSISDRVGRLLDGQCAVLSAAKGVLHPDAAKTFPLALDEKEMAVADVALRSNKPAGWSTDTAFRGERSLSSSLRKRGSRSAFWCFNQTIGVISAKTMSTHCRRWRASSAFPLSANFLKKALVRPIAFNTRNRFTKHCSTPYRMN